MLQPFSIRISSSCLKTDIVLHSNSGFKLDDAGLETNYGLCLSNRERDLLRIAMAVYVADRWVRRPYRRSQAGLSRYIHLAVDVADPKFWRSSETLSLLHDVLGRLARDEWSFNFNQGPRFDSQLPLLREQVAVGLYSGGLDSAAGLANRLRNDSTPFFAVTALHQSTRGRIGRQLLALESRFNVRIIPIHCRTRLVHPPKFQEQETSQRLRAFLFSTLGGVGAAASGTDVVDVFENGIGAINLSPQFGMCLGSMMTRGCQPSFLNAAGALLTRVADRPIEFRLPLLRCTKAESVRALAEFGLDRVATSSFSCVHFPLRNVGSAKQCGVCFACLGRRQALLTAGICEPKGLYEIDLFDAYDSEVDASAKLHPMKACLNQVADLVRIRTDGAISTGLRLQIEDSGALACGMTVKDVVDLHRRYAMEWMTLVGQAQALGLRWGNLVRKRTQAA